MNLLLASLAALLAGPLLLRFAGSNRPVLAALDGFVLVSVGGIVFLALLPQAIEQAGFLGLVAAVVGFCGVYVFERSRHHSRSMSASALLAVLGFALHEFFDGVSLAAAAGTSTPFLSGLVLHRLQVGLAVWGLIRAEHGRAFCSVALGLVAAGVALGFVFGQGMATQLPPTGVALLQGAASGILMHLALHRHDRPDPLAGRGWQVASGVGALAALFLLAVIPDTHEVLHAYHEHGGHQGILPLALDGAPALLLAYLGAGLIHAYLPQGTPRWMRGGSSLSQAFRGVAVAIPLPLCSCGVLPIYRSMIAQGAPPVAAMSILVAGPEIGVDAILLSLPLLGPLMTSIRVVAAFVVALVVALVAGRMAGRDASPGDGSASAPVTRSIREAVHFGFGRMVDETGPWILAGIAAAAWLAPYLDMARLAQLSSWIQVPAFAALGLPSYVCASGATPLMAVLLYQGLSPGAALAFLLTGPATNLSTFGALSALHGRRVAIAFGAGVTLTATALGLLTDLLFRNHARFKPAAVHPEAVQLLQYVCLGALAVLLAVSLLRQGARGFAARVVGSAGHDAGGRDPHASHHHAPARLSPDRDPSDARADDCCASPPPSERH